MTEGPWTKYAAPAEAVEAGPWTKYAVPEAAGPSISSGPSQVQQMPEMDIMGNPTGRMVDMPAQNKMPYGEQMGALAHDVGRSANRIASNVPFADRATAGLMAATGTGDYASNLEKVRAYNEQQAKDNPVGEGLASVAGASLTPFPALGWVARGAKLGDKIVRGGLAGGGVGLTEGLSSTKDLTQTDPTHLMASTLIGSGVGGTIPAVAHGAGAAYRWLTDAVLPSVEGLGKRAQRRVLDTIMADGPEEVQQELARLGPHAMLGDSGPSSRGATIGLAKDETGPGKTISVNNIRRRDLGTNQRLRDALKETMGPEESPQLITEALAAKRSELHAGLPGVFAETPTMDVSGPLATIEKKLKTAVGAEKAVLERARSNLTDKKDGILVPTSSSEKAHNAKMDLDSLIKHGDPTLGVAKGMFSKTQGTTGQVRREINEAIREQVPGYSEINTPSSKLAGVMDAIKAGRDKVLGGGDNALDPLKYAKQFPELPAEQQVGQRIGLTGRAYKAIGEKPNDLTAINSMMQGRDTGEAAGWNRRKLGTAFDEPTMSTLDQRVASENAFKELSGPALQNSVTTPAAKAIEQNRAASATGELFPNSWRNLTPTGLGAETYRWVANRLASALRSPVNPDLIQAQLAHAYTGVLGPRAQEMARQLIEGAAAQGRHAVQGDRLGRAVMTGAALGANAAGRQAPTPEFWIRGRASDQ